MEQEELQIGFVPGLLTNHPDKREFIKERVYLYRGRPANAVAAVVRTSWHPSAADPRDHVTVDFYSSKNCVDEYFITTKHILPGRNRRY